MISKVTNTIYSIIHPRNGASKIYAFRAYLRNALNDSPIISIFHYMYTYSILFLVGSLSDLDPGNRTCTYINVSYANLDDNSDQKSAIVIKGPSDVSRRETLFVHFWSEKPQREYFTVSYFLFPGWSRFNGR